MIYLYTRCDSLIKLVYMTVWGVFWAKVSVCAYVCRHEWLRTFGKTPLYESASLLWHGAQSFSQIQNTSRQKERGLGKLQWERDIFSLFLAKTNSYWKPPTSLCLLQMYALLLSLLEFIQHGQPFKACKSLKTGALNLFTTLFTPLNLCA